MAEGFIICGCAIYIEQDKEGGRDLYLEAESKSEMEFLKNKLYNYWFWKHYAWIWNTFSKWPLWLRILCISELGLTMSYKKWFYGITRGCQIVWIWALLWPLCESSILALAWSSGWTRFSAEFQYGPPASLVSWELYVIGRKWVSPFVSNSGMSWEISV